MELMCNNYAIGKYFEHLHRIETRAVRKLSTSVIDGDTNII